MQATTFDTLDYFEKLKGAGFTEQQAKIQAEAMRSAFTAYDASRMKEPATRADLRDVELRLLKWQFGIGIALAVIMA